MFARIVEPVPKLEKKNEAFMLAVKRLPGYAWLLIAVAILTPALIFFDLPILGGAVPIVCLIGWTVREAIGR